MIILKFGGTSISTRENISNICGILKREQKRQPVVIVSAVSGVTDLLLSLPALSVSKQKVVIKELIAIHQELAKSCFGIPPQEIQEYINQCVHDVEQLLKKTKMTPALQDELVSFGEKLSSFLISLALKHSGITSQQILASQLIITDDNFTNAEFLPRITTQQTREVLLPLLKKGIIPVITGFIASTRDGRTTTLGRGGSDYSASIIGFALKASEIQIWTDVDGLYTSDPRLILTATRLSKVTYREASELAAFGAKILHPRTILPAVKAKIPVKILNTLNPEGNGTLITTISKSSPRVSAIASQRKVKLINLYSTNMLHSRGFLAHIFTVFSKYDISVDLVSVSEVSVSVTLDNIGNLNQALTELKTFTSVTMRDVGIVSLVGEGITTVPHLITNIFSVLDIARIPIHMVSLGASDINISFAVDITAVNATVQLLHDSIFLREIRNERSFI